MADRASDDRSVLFTERAREGSKLHVVRSPDGGSATDATTEARLDAAWERDEIARKRDFDAAARDRAAEARERDTPWDPAHAAEDRAHAAQDRERAAKDREQAAVERLRSLVDREAIALLRDRDPQRRR